MASILNLVSSKIFINATQKVLKRSVMTTSRCCKEALEQLENNSYYEKYADKIAKLQHTSPDEFLARMDELGKRKTPKKKSEHTVEGKFSQLLKPKRALHCSETEETSLDKVMKIDLIENKTTEEIMEIWHQYHMEKDFISATIPVEDFEDLTERAKEFPTFLLPLPRSQGYEFIMLQFEKNRVHFTPLLYYQVHKENAPECLTITHYTELKDSKKIVLMRGEYNKNIIDHQEAQCLANQLQLYYVRPTPQKLNLLEIFTRRPDEFKHVDLIKQIETLTVKM